MRLSATLLSTILAVLVIGGTRPELAGMTDLLPCEAAPQVLPTPKPSAPKAPTHLRIIGSGGLEELSEDLLNDDLFVSGPNAGPEADYSESATATTTVAAADPHAYYVGLASRPDCFAAYSLRDNAQVLQYTGTGGPRDLAYLYPDDPDPRRQDAMRIFTPSDRSAPFENLHLALGAHHPKNLFIVEDRWWGAEYSYHNTKIGGVKGDPYFTSGGDTDWAAVQTRPQLATQNTHNLPPGGPYVLMLHPQSLNGSQLKAPFYRDGASGFPRLRLPYTAPSNEQRSYAEGVAPRDTSAGPQGAEFGVVAERWTRIWHFFERAPELDWESTQSPAGPRTAYRWSMWAADTARDPIRIINEAIFAIYPDSSGLSGVRYMWGIGNGSSAIPPGRGPMVAYLRNVVVLHGTSKADMVKLLVKPVK